MRRSTLTTPNEALPLERREFDADELMDSHPPIVRFPNKRIVFEIACPPQSRHRGRIEYTRWKAMPLPNDPGLGDAAQHLVARAGYYDYAPEPDLPGAVEWHVNFADRQLFGFYSTQLFAQDEMQVAEHPALGALCEALFHEGASAVTVENGIPTPALIMGVERRCSVATGPNASEGRPYGLYGNRFDRAPADAIRRATRPVDPPTITNLIAMAAPAGGRGRYRAHEIVHVLVTAYTGYRAAVLESARSHGATRPVVIHTGFWGCGAFGGNRILMAMLQALAAGMAEIDRMVFHTGPDGARDLVTAQETLAEVLADESDETLRERIERIEALGWVWGETDGN